MNKAGTRLLLAAGMMAAALGSAHLASAAIIKTTISLSSFKQQLGLKSVRYVFGQAPVLGINFYVNKKKGTVVFKVNDAVYDGLNPFYITAKAVLRGQTAPSSLPIRLSIGSDFKVAVSPT